MYLRVDFPSGRCYAAQVFDPSSAEWPPHPSRLFSALVASAYQSGNGMPERRCTALEWLESLPAPSIFAPKADLVPAPVTYVPPGDSSGRKGAGSSVQYEHGVHRWRQPRYFPSATLLDEPIVYYSWEQDPEPALFSSLESIADGVTHVGTSHSMAAVSAYLGELPVSPSYVPDQQGDVFLRVTTAGRLRELDSIFERTAGLRRPAAACEPLVAYRHTKSPSNKVESSDFEFIALRISDTMHGADTAAYLGRALRRAVMSVLGDNAPEAVHGHNNGVHVGWIPLPDVGHAYAKGRIVGVGIAIPNKMPAESRQQLLAGLNQVRDLRLPDGRVAKLSPLLPGEQIPQALKVRTWTRASTCWSTVTPVVLDRPPKKPEHSRLCHALVQSLEYAGYSKPVSIEISTFSRFNGAPPAFTVPADKPRYHATVHFSEPVTGPVIAGRLRYFGIGLFRPMFEPDTGEVK